MAEININYTSEALQESGFNDSDVRYSVIETIPFTESTINKNDWTTKVFTYDNYNYGLLIKKDPIVIDSNSLLIENTPVLYSYNNNLERVNGVHSNYSIKFFVYPCLDLRYLDDNVFTKETLRQFAGIDNNYNFAKIQYLYSHYNTINNKGTIPKYGLHNIVGGLECINYTDDRFAAYNIDINNLGINLPSDADRGINEETLQLFDINNAIHYLDQRLINKELSPYHYYYAIDRLIRLVGACGEINADSTNVELQTAITYIINKWYKSSTSINNKEKCMPYAFDNIISSNGKYEKRLNGYGVEYIYAYYNIILMGVKKVEEV